MRLPTIKTSFMRIVHFGRYVLAKLQSAGHQALAEGVAEATDQVLAAGRGIEDAAVPTNTAIAHRDWAVSALENAARDLRLALLSRGRDAVSLPPYTRIFPNGVSDYINIALGDAVRVFQGLISRVNAELAENDAARIAAVDQISAGLKKFEEAVGEVNAARNKVDMARTHCDEVRAAWHAEMLKVYGLLLAEHGKKGAEQFFPHWHKSGRKAAEVQGEGTTNVKGTPNSPSSTASEAGGEGGESGQGNGNTDGKEGNSSDAPPEGAEDSKGIQAPRETAA